MAVNKILEIDLNNLTSESLKTIDQQVEKIINSFENKDKRSIKEKFGDSKQVEKLISTFENRDKRTVREKFGDPLLMPNSQKEEGLQKIFGRKTFNNLLSFGTNPFGFIQGSVTKLIPFIGTALVVTGVIAAFIKQVDDFQKEFVNNVDGRIELFRSREQQAQIQAGLQQLIITTESGGAEPRDAYNTFNEFNTNQSRIEADFKIRDTAGVN